VSVGLYWLVDIWCLTPISTIFQLYRGDQFYWWTNTAKTTDLSEVTDKPTISLEMPVPSQDHYGFHSFPVVDWFCLFIYLWVLTFPLLDCSEFGNFVITLICIWYCESIFWSRAVMLQDTKFKSDRYFNVNGTVSRWTPDKTWLQIFTGMRCRWLICLFMHLIHICNLFLIRCCKTLKIQNAIIQDKNALEWQKKMKFNFQVACWTAFLLFLLQVMLGLLRFRQNQSTTGKLWKPQLPWLGTGISKEMVGWIRF
jgi:hypothetical protein